MDFKALGRIFLNYPARFAYAFGSRVTGRARPASDVDLAVYFSPKLAPGRRQELRLRLLGEICSALRRDDVDLVVLNEAGPLLAFRITATGKKIFSRDELARIRFEARAMSLYYDRLPAYQRSADAMLRRAAARGLA